ncbi:MAG: tRNA (adenosine(37)-N6)-threonylcarbamoyltransferase complex ATPase subunit type 1 TsaE [Verrucomicrobia bacterium]|nr:tRNA (adenosine(37)-N6)-threonylcarbamoyltransferase complex ATPase subunit type 1 TsaE [Verrucomicrobiota bacterium]
MERICQSPEETRDAGFELARSAVPGAVLALHGDLGAGKTEFVKGLAAGLGSNDAVSSPTFTLVHEYRGGRLPLFHFDWYRLERVEELEGIGYYDYLDQRGVTVIEWAAKFPSELPPRTRHVYLLFLADNAREVRW